VAVFFGVIARLYIAEEGPFEPYLQLGLGGGALGTAFDEVNGDTGETERYEETGAGPAVQLGAGFDFYVSPRLRLGPSLSLTQVSVDKIRRCRSGGGGDCVDLAKHDHGHLNAYAIGSARLTVLLGDEL
jgi:hypothetical protein